MIIRRSEQEPQDRYPGVPRYALASAEFGQTSLHVGDLSYLPGYGVPHHYHTGGAEETQIMLSGELECWVGGKRTTVYPGDTVTALPGNAHAFHNRTDVVARMITAFPVTSPETVHIDDVDLEDVSEHPSIIRAGIRRSLFIEELNGVHRVEHSGNFSGARSTYSYSLEIQPGSAVPVQNFDHEIALFLAEGSLTGIIGENVMLDTNDGAVVAPGVQYGFSNESGTVARLFVIHPVINPV